MNVIVMCEFSGRVREAFAARGHNAVSCDLLDSWLPGPHIKGDCLSEEVLGAYKEEKSISDPGKT